MINWRSNYAFALHRDTESRWSEARLILGSFLIILLVGTLFLVQPSSHNGEVTFILQMPVWWAYALCMVGAVIGCLSYIAKTLIQFGLAKYPPGWTVESTGGH